MPEISFTDPTILGVWGGTSGRQRKLLRRAMRVR